MRAKEQKLVSYRARLAEVWLLLVTGETWTQAVDLLLLPGFHINSGFDRVYLFDVRTGAVQRLDEGGDL